VIPRTKRGTRGEAVHRLRPAGRFQIKNQSATGRLLAIADSGEEEAFDKLGSAVVKFEMKRKGGQVKKMTKKTRWNEKMRRGWSCHKVVFGLTPREWFFWKGVGPNPKNVELGQVGGRESKKGFSCPLRDDFRRSGGEGKYLISALCMRETRMARRGLWNGGGNTHRRCSARGGGGRLLEGCLLHVLLRTRRETD